MTITLFPADAVDVGGGVMAPEYTGKLERQSRSTLLEPAQFPGARPFGSRSGVRWGTLASALTVTSSTWTISPIAGVIDTQASGGAGAYLWASDANESGSVTAADASYPRTDLIYARCDDPAEADGSSTPALVFGYLAGTPAASPAKPTTPARAYDLWTISVPVSGGGAPTSTMVAPYTVSAGAVARARNATRLAELVGGSAEHPLVAEQVDTGTRWRSTGAGWVIDAESCWSQIDTTNAAKRTLHQWGIAKGQGNDTAVLNIGITFPVPFASGCVPCVKLNIMGYRATGAFNPVGLTVSSDLGRWIAMAFNASATGAAIGLQPQVGTIGSPLDFYVSWEATGDAA